MISHGLHTISRRTVHRMSAQSLRSEMHPGTAYDAIYLLQLRHPRNIR